MREIVQTAQFKKDLRKIARSGRYRVEDLLEVVDDLARNKQLPERYRDHALTGDLSAYRECHIRPDWLLMYELIPRRLILVRTGSHSASGVTSKPASRGHFKTGQLSASRTAIFLPYRQ